MLDNIKDKKILLASNSPRRREIMKMLRIPFTSISLEGIDESYPKELELEKVPLYIARKKSRAYLERLNKGEIVITADTIVECDNRLMGKPKDLEEAKAMLRFLSGKTHRVFTGVVIADKEKERPFLVCTDVIFTKLSEHEINYYVENFLPLDKAGAYGIQEWIGAVGVESIKGSFYNVMGLPIHRLYCELKDF